ncbi:unnamed protein product [Rangifer tarandus platyrhynchus]|uniref:Uncharacterized protein n=2 Tax=Rangifer tarandus platyrhynchus TaxID=3082113 RepID=A0AC60A8K7_RANTA|nr:unnamed protein product [Rangifer tarandus platyrhynchus]
MPGKPESDPWPSPALLPQGRQTDRQVFEAPPLSLLLAPNPVGTSGQGVAPLPPTRLELWDLSGTAQLRGRGLATCPSLAGLRDGATRGHKWPTSPGNSRCCPGPSTLIASLVFWLASQLENINQPFLESKSLGNKEQ